MQKRDKEEQQLLAHLEEVSENQEKTKTRKKAEKQRLAEEKKKKKWIEYLKQLQNKVLTKDATLLGGTEASQDAGSK